MKRALVVAACTALTLQAQVVSMPVRAVQAQNSPPVVVRFCGAQEYITIQGTPAAQRFWTQVMAQYCARKYPRASHIVAHALRPSDGPMRCTGPTVGAFGSTAMENWIVQAAEAYCEAQVNGTDGFSTPVPTNQAIDVEYASGSLPWNGGGPVPCANGNTSIGSIMYEGIVFPTGCNDPSRSLYSCFNCYGVVDWPGSVDGAFTSLINLPFSQQGDNHANVELWLNSSASSGYRQGRSVQSKEYQNRPAS